MSSVCEPSLCLIYANFNIKTLMKFLGHGKFLVLGEEFT